MTDCFCPTCNKKVRLINARLTTFNKIRATKGTCGACGSDLNNTTCPECGLLKTEFGGNLKLDELKKLIKKEMKERKLNIFKRKK